MTKNAAQSKLAPWQPIATAPEGNDSVLLYFPRLGVAIGRRGKPRPHWDGEKVQKVGTWIISRWANFDFPMRNPPTHWMPLPPPPSP